MVFWLLFIYLGRVVFCLRVCVCTRVLGAPGTGVTDGMAMSWASNLGPRRATRAPNCGAISLVWHVSLFVDCD